jgi:hypothetical protein
VHVADAFDAMTSARAYRAAPSGRGVRRAAAFRGHGIRRSVRRGAARGDAVLAGRAEPALATLGRQRSNLKHDRAGTASRCAAGAASASAQQARPAALAIDSSAAVDVTVDADGNDVTGVSSIRQSVSVDAACGVVRPQIQRLANGE